MSRKIYTKDYTKIWFTADWHLHHNKPFLYEPRGFSSIEEHDEYILSTITDPGYVFDTDLIIHIGDFMFGKRVEEVRNVIDQIPCKIEFVCGNHDALLSKYMREVKRSYLPPEEELKIIQRDETTSIIVSHFPMLVWNKAHYGSWNLHGHCHGSLKDSHPIHGSQKRIDVGVDTGMEFCDGFMWSFSKLRAYMSKKDITAHH